MRVHSNIEKPTAQIYYRKLIDETKLDATWNLVRFKVRHLKGGWQKADAHRKSIVAGGEESDKIDETTLQAKLLRMCPHYEQLSDIFSVRKQMEMVVRDSQGSWSSLDMSHCEDESTTDPPITSGIGDLSQHQWMQTEESFMKIAFGLRGRRSNCTRNSFYGPKKWRNAS
ncbi:uncharacterized protein LOC115769696 isoform X2 [Drosophila novamexicana]|nr:uncharacterized protein LOC115769696 isoform X2 [Drosophila novamexicana]